MTCYVYILPCEDGSYYTGYTKNVISRFEKHKKGHGARYTRMHKPERLVYVEEFDTYKQAIKREREIKSLNHSQKQRRINTLGYAS